MKVEGVSPVDVARMFQPARQVFRPSPIPAEEVILNKLDAAQKSFTKLRSNHVGHANAPNG